MATGSATYQSGIDYKGLIWGSISPAFHAMTNRVPFYHWGHWRVTLEGIAVFIGLYIIFWFWANWIR